MNSINAPAHGSWWVQRWSGRYRWWFRFGLIVLVLILLLAVDLVTLSLRVGQLPVKLPTGGGPGENFVVVGSDSRADLPLGASTATFGTTTQSPGAHADVVLLVHRAPDGSTTTFSIPRDLLVQDASGAFGRLTLSYSQGAQQFIDGLCRSLGVRTDHLLVVDFDGFTSVIDALGGIRVDLAHPTRDTWTGLNLPGGAQTINGDQALALVRSRHGQQLIGVKWVGVSEGAGALQRVDWAGVVFAAVRTKASAAKTNPLAVQRLAWVASGHISTDRGTGLSDLVRLAMATGSPVDLPAQLINPQTLAMSADADTFAALSKAGLDGGCVPAS